MLMPKFVTLNHQQSVRKDDEQNEIQLNVDALVCQLLAYANGNDGERGLLSQSPNRLFVRYSLLLTCLSLLAANLCAFQM